MLRFLCLLLTLLTQLTLVPPVSAARSVETFSTWLPPLLPMAGPSPTEGSASFPSFPEIEDVSQSAPLAAQTKTSDVADMQNLHGKVDNPRTVEANSTDRNAAAAIISGSPRPGIIEHQLIRCERVGKPEINISYPSLGVKGVDSDIRQWVTSIANAFDSSFDNDQDIFHDNHSTPELWGSYSITSPSTKAVSVTFEIWTYTGSAHGNLDIITLNYNTLTSQRLGVVDIFEDPDAALSIMSSLAYKELSKRLGGLRQEHMLRADLATVPENFASLTLTPQGLRVNFQPYQVAPWAAGAQRVDIPLDALRPARPLLLLWGG